MQQLADSNNLVAELQSNLASQAAADQDEPLPHPRVPGQLDKGIRRAVEILQANGIETFESCEGGPGHAYPEPTIAFYGTIGGGWAAVKVCLDYGLPVLSLRMVWDVLEGLPTGPHWEITFRSRMN